MVTTVKSHPLSVIKYRTILIWPAWAAAYSGVHLSCTKQNNCCSKACLVAFCFECACVYAHTSRLPKLIPYYLFYLLHSWTSPEVLLADPGDCCRKQGAPQSSHTNKTSMTNSHRPHYVGYMAYLVLNCTKKNMISFSCDMSQSRHIPTSSCSQDLVVWLWDTNTDGHWANFVRYISYLS